MLLVLRFKVSDTSEEAIDEGADELEDGSMSAVWQLLPPRMNSNRCQ